MPNCSPSNFAVGLEHQTPYNYVTTSIGTDGTIFNGTGYKDDSYLSSGNGTTGSKSGWVATGYMKIPTTIYVKGATWTNDNNSRACFFNEDFSFRGTLYGANANQVTSEPAENGFTKLTFSTSFEATKAYVYARMCFQGTGANLIIQDTPQI